jgi:hypothetical protein
VRHVVLEETERAFVKVQQYTYTVALVDDACCIVVLFAVAPEAAISREHEPAVSAHPVRVVPIWVEVWPGHTDKDRIARLIGQNFHLPIVLARR